jgi:hypothetical protein
MIEHLSEPSFIICIHCVCHREKCLYNIVSTDEAGDLVAIQLACAGHMTFLSLKLTFLV